MGRDNHIRAIGDVVEMIAETPELLEQIAANSDNIDYGEMIYVSTGPSEGFTAFTSRDIESLQEFIADVRHGPAACVSSSSTKCATPQSSRKSWLKSRGNNRVVTVKPIPNFKISWDDQIPQLCLRRS